VFFHGCVRVADLRIWYMHFPHIFHTQVLDATYVHTLVIVGVMYSWMVDYFRKLRRYT
jgi:hypothetical protein